MLVQELHQPRDEVERLELGAPRPHHRRRVVTRNSVVARDVSPVVEDHEVIVAEDPLGDAAQPRHATDQARLLAQLALDSAGQRFAVFHAPPGQRPRADRDAPTALYQQQPSLAHTDGPDGDLGPPVRSDGLTPD